MAHLSLQELHRRYAQQISFCVHIKNRLHQLRETLPVNLDVVRRHPGTGLVLVNYNSDDGLHEWMIGRFGDDIAAGRLLYARERHASSFHASKSKNLAHRLGPGQLLVNLDCDNFIGDTVPFLLDVAGRNHQGVLVHMWTGVQRDGTYGRIGISRDAFLRIGGYDESLLPMGFQDQDLIKRARLSGVPVIVPRRSLDVRAIRNSKEESLRHSGSRVGFRPMNRLNRLRSAVNIWRRGFVANPRGWGRATLEINFEDQLALG